jgi:neutral ceramidase
MTDPISLQGRGVEWRIHSAQSRLRRLPRLLAGVAAVAQFACAPHIHRTVKAYQRIHSPAVSAWSGGTKRVEITPLSGYPMGGHGLGGRVSRGRWLPLYARAFYLRDSAGESIVLVSCDLPAMPARLQQEVAFRVNLKYPEISRENLILAATHTHHAPGNFMSSPFYSGFLSQMPGFDESQFEEVAQKVAGCVIDAITNAASPSSVEVRFGVADIRAMSGVKLFVRNRAVAPLLLNHPTPEHPSWPNVCDFLYPGGPAQPCQCFEVATNCDVDSIRRLAFDGRLTVLSIVRTTPTPRELGRLVFFGTHPTAMSDHSTFYSSDYTGLAMRMLEKSTNDSEFVAGFFNGTDGDVSPNWLRQDAEDVRAMAKEFLAAIDKVLPATALPGSASIHVHRLAPKQRDFCHGSVPVMGAATMGGAEDGRAVTFDLGWRAPERMGVPYKRKSFWTSLGLWRLNNPNQGNKQPALDYSPSDALSLTELLAPPRDYPKEVPLMVARLGNIQLLAVPFEVTTFAGEQIHKALAPLAPGPTLIIGLANEYLSYMTTEAEYSAQEYEGASTLYGKAALECLTAKLKETATLPGVGPALQIPATDFDVGTLPPLGAFLGPRSWGANPIFGDKSLESPFEEAAFASPWPRLEWDALQDARLEIFRNGGAGWVKVADDDDSFLLLELIDGKGSPTRPPNRWNAVWLHRDPIDTLPFIFVARSGSVARCSAPFSPKDVATGAKPLPLPVAPCPPGVP